jgi:DNA-binding CsgD family transcriptional regulator
MDSLTLATVRKLMLAVERIHSVAEPDSFGPEVFAATAEILPEVFINFEPLDLRTGQVSSVRSEEERMSAGIEQRMVELLPEHPAVNRVQADAKGAICVTDCVSQREFRNSTYHSDVMVPLGLNFQTVDPVDIPSEIAGLTVNREKNFSDRETAFLALLAPHIALACTNLQRKTILQRKLAGLPFPDSAAFEAIGLTPRESEVMHWMIQGRRDSEIVTILGEARKVSLRTINNHVRNILVKMNAETRTGACINALERIKNL